MFWFIPQTRDSNMTLNASHEQSAPVALKFGVHPVANIDLSSIDWTQIKSSASKPGKVKTRSVPEEVFHRTRIDCLFFYEAHRDVEAQQLLRLLIELAIAGGVNNKGSIINVISSFTEYSKPRIAVAVQKGAGTDASRHRWHLNGSAYELHAAPSDEMVA
jgi:hypothetical protein